MTQSESRPLDEQPRRIRECADGKIRLACEAGEYEAAATQAIELYGEEIFRFLCGRMSDQDSASEVFAQFSEDFWKGLPRFEWRSSLRTWAYRLVHNRALRFRQRQRRAEQRHVPISQAGPLAGAVERTRTATLEHLRSEVKTRMQDLRSELPEIEQTILLLRVDRRMSWLDIAEVMHEGASPDEPTRRRSAARLRKRFESTKRKLRQLAERDGLVAPAET